MRLKRFLSTLLAATMLIQTVSEPIIASASSPDKQESKFHEIVNTGSFEECTDALLRDFLSYGKVPKEKRETYLKSLTDEERYQFQVLAKYAYVDSIRKLGETPEKEEENQVVDAITYYAEIASEKGKVSSSAEKKICKKIGKLQNQSLSDYDDVNRYYSEAIPYGFQDLLIEIESVPSVDTESLSKNVNKYKSYIHSVFGFSDKREFNDYRLIFLNGLYQKLELMSKKEKEELFSKMNEEELYEMNLIAKYHLLTDIYSFSINSTPSPSILNTITNHAKDAIQIAIKAKDANPKNKEDIRKNVCRHLSLHYAKETDSFHTFHKELQENTDLKISSVLKEIDRFSKTSIGKEGKQLSEFQSYLYDTFGISNQSNGERATATDPLIKHVVKKGDKSTYIPADYSFNPKFIPGVTQADFDKDSINKGSYKWTATGDGGCKALMSGKSYYKPKPTDNNKLAIRYINVGEYRGEKVDMRITFMEFSDTSESDDHGCRGITYGGDEVAYGMANFWNNYHKKRYLKMKIDMLHSGTNALFSNIKGYMTLNDLDYFKYTDQATSTTVDHIEEFHLTQGCTRQVYLNETNDKKINVKTAEHILAAKTGVGGKGPADGGNVVYCFYQPTHIVTWRGAINNHNAIGLDTITPEEVEQENRIRHWLNGFTTGGTNDSKKNFLFDETYFGAPANTKITMDKAKKSSKMPKGFQVSYFRQYNGSGWTRKEFPSTITQEKKSMYFEYRYDPIEYKITYQDYGTNSPNNPDTYNILNGVTFSKPTKPGYRFLGWQNVSTGKTITGINPGKTENFSSASAMITELNKRTTDEPGSYKSSLNYFEGIYAAALIDIHFIFRYNLLVFIMN